MAIPDYDIVPDKPIYTMTAREGLSLVANLDTNALHELRDFINAELSLRVAGSQAECAQLHDQTNYKSELLRK